MNINTFHSIVNLNVHPFSHICSYYSFGLAVEANQGNPNSTEIELGPAQPQLVYLLFGCNSPPKSATTGESGTCHLSEIFTVLKHLIISITQGTFDPISIAY